jgi:Zn-dependent M28 family amino/carboxypeptidase
MRKVLAALLCCSAVAAVSQQHPRDGEIHDADTKAWWHTTEFLSSDAMEGRDTGSGAYQEAADYVAKRFKLAGLKPAGENGTYFQTVPMHEVDLQPERSFITITMGSSGELGFALKLLEEVTVNFSDPPPAETNGELVFRGYCGREAMTNVSGKIVLCFGTQRSGLPNAAERMANARAAGAIGIVSIDDPYFTIEPPRWPYAYARSVRLRDGELDRRPTTTPLLALRLSADAFTRLLSGSGHDAAAILKSGGTKQTLTNFDLPGYVLHARIETTEKNISSPNVLAVLPGSDPALKDEYVVIAAHLDGYGYGTPVKGDNLYNGALDDAAYVALLLQYADNVKAGKLPRPKRSVLICAFTGEEKGLLGSTWFVEHPTVPKDKLIADINLDQLRPLFPLKILTVPGIDLTSLGKIAREVASAQHIELRDDREPERNLLHRADNWPFLRAGIPAIGFVFGFDPGTESERRYREWYEVRYHRPQDDVTQPMDFDAARDFNQFFYKLTDAVADTPEKPAIYPQK